MTRRAGSTPERHWALRLGSGPERSAGQLAAVGAQVVAVLGFLLALEAATGPLDQVLWLVAVVPVATMAWVGSIAPMALWGMLLLTWFVRSPEGAFTWWAVPAAAAVVVGHAAAALAASVPPATRLQPSDAVRWARWTGVAAAASLPVGALASVLQGDATGASAAGVGALVGLAGLAAGVLLLRTEPPTSRD